MQLTDTHTHLYAAEFDSDRDLMFQRAIEANVTRFFVPAIDSNHTLAMYELENHYPEAVFLMAGLHPCYVKDNYEAELAHVEAQLTSRKFVAIGEIGIDLFWDTSTLAIQKVAFKRQIQLAKKYKLPIVIHCRNSFDEVIAVLEEEKSPDLFGVLHCFTGTLEQAQMAIGLQMKLGIGGVVTFKNGKVDAFLNQIPLEHLVLETDSPYLAPVPYRGKRNESSYLALVAAKVASLYQMPLAEVARITTENSKQIFGI